MPEIRVSYIFHKKEQRIRLQFENYDSLNNLAGNISGVVRNMTRLYTILLTILFFTSCKSQSVHSDCMEYGYVGKIKQINKTTLTNIIATDITQIPKDSKGDLKETYFINVNGNIDSLLTERENQAGEIFAYIRKFYFEHLKRKNWDAYSLTNEKLMSGTIDWMTAKQFDEKVFYQSGELKFETVTSLNDSFRIFKILIKGFDQSGNLTQNSIQEFTFSTLGDINSITTTNLIDNKADIKKYEYLSKDKVGNPTEILITKLSDNSRSLVRLEYQYYN